MRDIQAVIVHYFCQAHMSFLLLRRDPHSVQDNPKLKSSNKIVCCLQKQRKGQEAHKSARNEGMKKNVQEVPNLHKWIVPQPYT